MRGHELRLKQWFGFVNSNNQWGSVQFQTIIRTVLFSSSSFHLFHTLWCDASHHLVVLTWNRLTQTTIWTSMECNAMQYDVM